MAISAIPQNIFENDIAKQAVEIRLAVVLILDLLVDVPLFVRQEEVEITIPADQGFPLEPKQTLLDLGPERAFVGVDLVHEKRDQIVDIGRNLFNVANEKKRLENPSVKIALVCDVLYPADRCTDNTLKKALDCGVESIQRN